ncbi:MAG TPA: CheR family methyltransferase [Stellaceae bacterium]|nr:CheR family methyltransferase [Stellaceae bacterium]
MADRFPIVGIGASAGGVEALQAFFAPMPGEPGMAFVVATHLGERHESALPQIIARTTALRVQPISNGALIEPNHVYVLSEDMVLTVRRGRLRLRPHPARARERHVIDVFLASLAEDQGEQAVAVILSGVGHDGSLGAKAIKEKGGLTIAQAADHITPRYPDMPFNAIASGAIDLSLPVQEMAGKLIEYVQGIGTLNARTGANLNERTRLGQARQTICDVMREAVGHDFSGYKERTFLRRIERRMQVLELRDIDRYVDRLREDRREVVQLFHNLLIGVTAFFRDREAFEALKQQVIPQLFEGKSSTDSVRVWIPGCATGEEAYSIAILLLEHLATVRVRPKLVVFATDIDDPAVTVARAARYPAALLQDVSQDRLDRFFSGDGISYTLTSDVRDVCIFSSHSIIRDPPFSRIDLISCRNLLIYLDRGPQHQLIPIFHYALRPGGYLFLGTSETLTQHAELFAPLDKKNRIFQRREQTGVHPGLPLRVPSPRHGLLEPRPVLGNNGTTLPLRHVVESRVLDQFAPAHVVVTRDGDVIHFSNRTGKYLENAPGAPNRNVMMMARRGLRVDLRTTLAEAVESRRSIRRAGIRVQVDDRIQFIDLSVEPLPDRDVEPLFLIVFSDLGSPLTPEQLVPLAVPDQATSTEQIERELRDTRERLQSMVEEYETALEELKSANEELVSINEELQSSNEELQSSNEELETSREEAQSVNEELHTVNSELQRKVEELDRANENLRSLFDGTEIATVVVDRNLVIRSFTPAIRSIFNLMEVDRGRPLTDIVSGIVDLDLRREVGPVLATGEGHERRVVRRDGKAHYLMRVLPYHAVDKSLDGALVTFTDITRITEIEQYQEETDARIQTMLDLVLDTGRRSFAGHAPPLAFLQRIETLARIYRLIWRARWGGVALADLTAVELENFGIGREGRVSIEGPPVLLDAKAAIGIGMALHELAADAATHGALSVPQGRVHVVWQIERTESPDARLLVHWRESDGPAVRPPEATGYGTALIEAELMARLGAAGALTFGQAGVSAELALPLASGLVLLSDPARPENGPRTSG